MNWKFQTIDKAPKIVYTKKEIKLTAEALTIALPGTKLYLYGLNCHGHPIYGLDLLNLNKARIGFADNTYYDEYFKIEDICGFDSVEAKALLTLGYR